jgi:CubicO group peptidase (beta-lactamase class C family)
MLTCAVLLLQSLTGAAAPGVAAPNRDPGEERALATIARRARESQSDAVLILKDDEVVFEYHSDKGKQPIETMSVTKSIVNLAMGRLVELGRLKTLDEPVYRFFPEWKQGRKQLITVRQLLNHTSGLQDLAMTGPEIYPSPDAIKLALAAELTSAPGERFFYSNKAVNLLAGIVKVASGKPLDVYVREQVLAPLGISHAEWDKDPSGNPYAMAGLRLSAADLAKIGQMLAAGGVFAGKRLLSEAWIGESTRAGQSWNPKCGLLWWVLPAWTRFTVDDGLLDEWKRAGDSASFLKKAATLKGKTYSREEFGVALQRAFVGTVGQTEWQENTWKKGLPDTRLVVGPQVGYYADGYLGQYLVVLPEDRIVAVRLMASPENDPSAAEQRDTFSDFPAAVMALRGHVDDDDVRILERADRILAGEGVWNRADDRNCPPSATRFSLFCALEKASREVTGEYVHRRAALQAVRFAIEEATLGRRFSLRMMDFNNLPETRFADVKRILGVASARIKARLVAQGSGAPH